MHTLTSPSAHGVEDYVDARWDWASMQGQCPVVVEEFLDAQASFCVEYYIGDLGAQRAAPSTLEFEDRKIVREIIGRLPLTPTQSQEFVASAAVLAQRYHAIGYRGYVCFDAVLSAQGHIYFTEANARTATGTHLNAAFEHLLSEEAGPLRIVQVNSDPTWGALSTAEFLQIVQDNDLAFNWSTGHGIAMTTPPVSDRLAAGFLYMIGSAGPEAERAYQDKLLACVSARKGAYR